MKDTIIRLKAATEWKQRVSDFAGASDRSLSQYIRDAVNAQMRRDAKRK